MSEAAPKPPLAARLVRAPRVRLSIEDSGEIVVTAGGERLRLPAGSLALLDALGRPATLAEALQRLPVHGVRDFMDLTAAAGEMLRAGVLLDADAPSPPAPGGWGSTSAHVALLTDTRRTLAFKRAIEAVVKPGDVVIDVGTGTGILAVFAAQAGARRVYALEASPMHALARRVFESNGVADRVEIVHGWSSQATLPERADVMVSETLGDDPFDERILDTAFDAVARHLKPGARLIPRRIRLVGRLVSLSEAVAKSSLFGAHNVELARRAYGVDLGDLREHERRGGFAIDLEAPLAQTLEPLSDPFVAIEVEPGASPLAFRRDLDIETTRSGTVEGVLTHFEALLADAVTLASDPFDGGPGHWRNRLALLEPRSTRAGERVALRYARDASLPGFTLR